MSYAPIILIMIQQNLSNLSFMCSCLSVFVLPSSGNRQAFRQEGQNSQEKNSKMT